MRIKICGFLALLSLLVLISPTFHGFAEEIPLGAWSGAAGLTVPTGDEEKSCPDRTSHGHGIETPCSPLVIQGTEEPSNGSVYAVTGGVGPYSWSVSGGTITSNGESLATINVDGACGSGTITVSDACGSVTKEICFPIGTWRNVETSSFSSTNYLINTVISGKYMTKSVWVPKGVIYSAQYSMNGNCYDQDRTDTAPADAVTCGTSICGETSGRYYGDQPGTWQHPYTVYDPCHSTHTGFYYTSIRGWVGFGFEQVISKEEWQCE